MADKTQIMKEAQKHLARGQLDKAIAEWEKLIRESSDGNTLNTIGDLYLKKGDQRSARDSFHKAAGFFRNEGFSLKALALYKKVLNLNPHDADALYALGQLSEEKGLGTDAIKYYLAAADSLAKEGKKDRLLEIYQKILSISPANIPLRNKVAEIFLKEGLRSDGAKEYIRIAEIYAEKGDITKAREYYQKVLDMQPLSKEAIVGIANLFERAGDTRSALSQMKDAASRFPDDPEILCRCAELYLANGDVPGAKNTLSKVLDVDEKHIEARSLLAEVYLKEGNKAGAWVEYRIAIDEIILRERYEDAIRLLVPFKDIDPLETGRRLVSLYRQIGDSDMVAVELTDLGDALRGKGLVDDAIGCYKDALELKAEDETLKGKIDELTRKAEFEPDKIEELPAVEPEGGKIEEFLVPEGDKTTDEVLGESDIFARYGLISEALKLIEGLKLKDPQNIGVHTRLKSLYAEAGDKDAAVTECLILNELYKRRGDAENAEAMLHEAFALSPDDPRLAERGFFPSPVSAPQPVAEEQVEAAPDIADFEEEIAEADFYARQGLIQEATKILERLHALFPDNRDIEERMHDLGQIGYHSEAAEVSVTPSEEETSGGAPPPEGAGEEVGEAPGPASPETEEPGGYEDFSLTEQDLVEAEAMPEPALESDVLEIFQEFKKGLEKELGSEDSETHYNLGIAYKEMGLIDDAIKEFQLSRDDPKKFLPSSTMLGVCYMDKGLFSLAIDALGKALERTAPAEETHWAIKYDLAEAYEKNGDLKAALSLYTEVYGWNAGFRGVSDRLSSLKARSQKDNGQERPKERKDRVSYL